VKAVSQHRLTGVLGRLRQATDASGGGSPTDAELLGRYVATRDAAAFELLVWRHGAMVLSACRRLLARHDDADDAFQATFLTLVRRAAAISKHEAVAGWLHTVACRVALRARTTAARRARREQSGLNIDTEAASNGRSDPAVSAELGAALDAEIMRLPRKLRDPFVLCYLEGLSNQAAAGQLGCPKGTVLSRLARARARLRGRLTRRGLGLPGVVLGAGLFPEALAGAPAPLVVATMRAASLLAAGSALTSAASAPVAALTQGVLQAMFISKLKIVATVVVGLAVVAAGSGQVLRTSAAGPAAAGPAAAGQAAAGQAVAGQAAGQEAPRPAATKAAKPAVKPAAKLSVADTEVDVARLRLTEAQILLRQRESDLRTAETTLKLMQIDVEKATLELERAREVYRRLVPGGLPPAAPKKQPPPAPDSPAPDSPPMSPPQPASTTTAEAGLRVPAGAQTDLIQLATTYVDAVRDLRTAKIRLSSAEAGVTPVSEREIQRVNVEAAQRKVELLREIITGAMHGAERELQDHARLTRLHERGFVARPDTSAAENKVRVLKMILETAK